MPGGAQQAQYIEDQEQRLKQFSLHLSKRCPGIDMQINARETHSVGVECDVGERNPASPALRRVHPVARPRIAEKIRLPSIPDVKTIEGVEKNRKPHTEEFQHWN